MNKKKILKETETMVQKKFEKEGTGHDWWHVKRVCINAASIAKKEKGVDVFIVQLGALLHDIADYKFHNGDELAGGRATKEWLSRMEADTDMIEKVAHIVDNVSFKGLGVASRMHSLEGKIVQDADRLDAIGAIGIARSFAYGGHKGKPIFDPTGKVQKHTTFAQYKKENNSSVHHFYEKLIHLKGLMNTKTGKAMAKKRHAFLMTYLKEFHAEWEGKK
ncbi:MAG: HD domain-containing protein [Candidatus Azambacteria bacterium]|nr:HD domain-containing protein [Candidatus Azambacteria bacterium]